MCSRYYVDLEVAKELRRLAGETDDASVKETEDTLAGGLARAAAAGTVDVCPSQNAVLVLGQGGRIVLRRMRWGYPPYGGEAHDGSGRLLINARAETAAEKPMFRESLHPERAASFAKKLQCGRCAVPAAGFYEWNRSREKVVFTHRASSVFYMAGLYRRIDGEDRFVVLTTRANASVAPVHERMPLILEADELEMWLCDDTKAAEILAKTPGMLKRSQDYEQLSLF